jgi:hypothetical protein
MVGNAGTEYGGHSLRGRVITVCDREGDMYELFTKAQDLKKPYTIKEAIDYLGESKRAPSDGPPGVKTIWIGLMKPLSTS